MEKGWTVTFNIDKELIAKKILAALEAAEAEDENDKEAQQEQES